MKMPILPLLTLSILILAAFATPLAAKEKDDSEYTDWRTLDRQFWTWKLFSPPQNRPFYYRVNAKDAIVQVKTVGYVGWSKGGMEPWWGIDQMPQIAAYVCNSVFQTPVLRMPEPKRNSLMSSGKYPKVFDVHCVRSQSQRMAQKANLNSAEPAISQTDASIASNNSYSGTNKTETTECVTGDRSACRNVAMAYEAGWWGLSKDQSKAKFYRVLSWELIIDASFYSWVESLVRSSCETECDANSLVSSFVTQAEVLCDEKCDEESCELLAAAYEHGIAVEKSRKLAKQYSRKPFYNVTKREQTFDNGLSYSGEVNKKEVPHGTGSMSFPTGDRYEGQWCKGKMTGQGKMFFGGDDPYAQSYEGNFLNGDEHGYGVLTFLDGRSLAGEWINGDWPKSGKLTFPDGSYYEGEFEDGSLSGNGTMVFAIGDFASYTGQFKDDHIHGRGNLVYRNGDVYEGEFLNHQMHGKGKLTFAAGETKWIEGVWKNGEPAAATSAMVQRDFENGDRYDGLLDGYGTPHGYGEYFFADGSSYKGEWKNGKPHGAGAFDSLAEKWEGNFVNGERDPSSMKKHWVNSLFGDVQYTGNLNSKGQWHGKGEASWPDGSVYDGQWKNGLRSGHGELTLDDGRKLEGEWVDGVMRGTGRLSYPDGTTMSGFFVDGNLDGVVKIQTRGSDLITQVLYSQGEPVEYLSDNSNELRAQELARIEQNRQAELARIERDRQAVMAQQSKELAAMEAERRRFQSNMLLLQLGNAIATGQPMFGVPSTSSSSSTSGRFTYCVYDVIGDEVIRTINKGMMCPGTINHGGYVGHYKRQY